MRRLFMVVVTTVMLAGLLAAVQRPEPNRDFTATTAIGAVQPRISPDGQTIAVSYQGALWTLPRAGGVMMKLTNDAGYDIEPAWSPDGQRIAFVNSPRFGSGDLRIVTKAGQDVPLKKRVEVLGTVLYQKLEWLDDERLLGVLKVDGQSLGYAWVNLKTGDTKTVAPTSNWGRFSASADGKWLAFTTTLDQPGQQTGNDGISADVWRVPTSGGEPESCSGFRRAFTICAGRRTGRGCLSSANSAADKLTTTSGSCRIPNRSRGCESSRSVKRTKSGRLFRATDAGWSSPTISAARRRWSLAI